MTELAKGALSLAEQDFLEQCEETIATGLHAFFEVGEALALVRDNKLYRSDHKTFEEYCRDRWGFNRHRAAQLIGATEVVTNVTKIGLPAPENEAQARELGRVPESARSQVWEKTLEATGGKPTAAQVRAVAQEVTVSSRSSFVEVQTLPAAVDEGWPGDERVLRKRLLAGETVVASLRDHHARFIDWADRSGLYVRIDRRTEWGNPFEMPADGDRDTVIRHYAEHYLPNKPSLLSKLDGLRGKALGCWCAPEPCHGDVLKAWAEGTGEQC